MSIPRSPDMKLILKPWNRENISRRKDGNIHNKSSNSDNTNRHLHRQIMRSRIAIKIHATGFSRITFEWEIPSLKKSEWNRAAAAILADQWKIWYHQHMLFSTKREETVDAIAVIGRWLKYSSKIPMIQNPNQEGTSEEISLAEKARSEAAERRRVKRSAVAELRKETAFTVLSERPLLELITTDSVSDYEESEDPTDPPSRILPYWRSELLGDVMHELDLATFQLAAPNKKQEILAVLARRGSRGATEDDVPAENAPHGFPAEVYSEHFASDTSQLERGPSRYPSGRFGPISMNLSKALLTLRASTIKPQETPTGSKMPHTD
ncbi:hypothetical protein MJO29_016375 [Puccinia striiformis f. sp. tritici]|nr:hypothetical protein MJO29_016375 [Puccinia striiformis f. sp. tritici]